MTNLNNHFIGPQFHSTFAKIQTKFSETIETLKFIPLKSFAYISNKFPQSFQIVSNSLIFIKITKMAAIPPGILKQPSIIARKASRVSTRKPETQEEKKLRKKEEKKILNAQKKLEKSQQQFRDYLTREKNFGKVSKDRGWEDWDKWWRQVGLDGLKDDLAVAAKTVDCFMDRSELAVMTVEEHRLHAGEQHQRLFVRHLESIDRLFGKIISEHSSTS